MFLAISSLEIKASQLDYRPESPGCCHMLGHYTSIFWLGSLTML